MADLRTSFMILEDSATAAGLPLHKALEGETATAKNAHGVFAAKDPSGNFKYLETNAQNELKVSTAGDEAYVKATGTVAGSASFVAVATLTLVAGKTYRNIGWIVSCYRDAEFKFVQVDDMTTTDVTKGIIVGSGAPTDSDAQPGLSVVAGASGTQTLAIHAKNASALSDFRATLTAIEVQ